MTKFKSTLYIWLRLALSLSDLLVPSPDFKHEHVCMLLGGRGAGAHAVQQMPVPAHSSLCALLYLPKSQRLQPASHEKNREAALAQEDSVPSLLLYKLLSSQRVLLTSVHTLQK